MKSINLKDEDYVIMTDTVDQNNSIIMATQRGAMKRIAKDILQDAKRAQRGITLLKELKKNPHRIVAAYVVRDETYYTLYSDKHAETGEISNIHLSEQYTNGSFVVDTNEFGNVKSMIIN